MSAICIFFVVFFFVMYVTCGTLHCRAVYTLCLINMMNYAKHKNYLGTLSRIIWRSAKSVTYLRSIDEEAYGRFGIFEELHFYFYTFVCLCHKELVHSLSLLPRPSLYTRPSNMPTVILLDKSLSMKRPARTEARTDTRLSLATEGLEFFLSYLERCFPMEYTCLMAFSSSCEVLAPFTRDSKELVEQLGQVTCADRTDLHKALQCVVETVITEWGMFVPCQLVLVTDGRLGLGLGGRQQPVCLPFPCQLHVVCIASEKEVSAYSQLHPSVELAGIKTTSVHVPRSDPLTHNLVLETFSNLVTAYYWPYLGNLKCGHLQSKVCISPSPSMCRSSCDIVVESNQRFSSPLADLDFPSEIIICGFLDLAVISAPAIYSRHFVLDGEFDSEAVTRLIKRLREKTEEEEKSVNKEKPSFRVILHGSLKMESKVAVVMLGWVNGFTLTHKQGSMQCKLYSTTTLVF